MNKRGFTLIEVMIAVAILATLTMLVARSIQQGIAAKAKIQGQIDDISKMRDALRLMERDINLAYHHRDFEKDLEETLKKKKNPNPTPSNPSGNPFSPLTGQPTAPMTPDPVTPDPPREAPRQDPSTHFVGTGEEMSFVTQNTARMVRNSRQADFIEVGYSLRNCKSADGSQNSNCLWRRSSNSVDKDVSKGGDEVVLLEDVTDFKLQYIGKGKQDWVTSWRSDEGGDAITKNNFPQAVEITLGVSKGPDGGRKTYKLTIVASVHFPNNKEAGSAQK